MPALVIASTASPDAACRLSRAQGRARPPVMHRFKVGALRSLANLPHMAACRASLRMPALLGAPKQVVTSRVSPSLRLRSRARARPVTRQRSVVRITKDSRWDSKAAGATKFILDFSGSTSERGVSGVGGTLYERIDKNSKDSQYTWVGELQASGGDAESCDLHYVALIKCLRAATDNGVEHCIIETHVNYIYEQLKGKRQAPGTCQEELYRVAKEEIGRLASFEIELIDRTKNTAIERARKASEGECWYGWWLANGSKLHADEEFHPPTVRRQAYNNNNDDDDDDYYYDDHD